MTPIPLGGWTPFFTTAASASASLAGLVMVALSVNIQRIIQYRHLPSRAAASIGALVLILITSLGALIPQPTLAFAIEVDVCVAFGWVLHVTALRQLLLGHKEIGRPRRDTVLGICIGQMQAIPFTVGGVLLTLDYGPGLYWIAAGVAATLVFAVVNAWVLLVEILR